MIVGIIIKRINRFFYVANNKSLFPLCLFLLYIFFLYFTLIYFTLLCCISASENPFFCRFFNFSPRKMRFSVLSVSEIPLRCLFRVGNHFPFLSVFIVFSVLFRVKNPFSVFSDPEIILFGSEIPLPSIFRIGNYSPLFLS